MKVPPLLPQANAIVETTKTAHRLKLDVLFHAPSILIPYSTDSEEGGIHINLGDLTLSNRYPLALVILPTPGFQAGLGLPRF